MVELELLKEDVFQLWKYIRAVKSRQKIGEGCPRVYSQENIPTSP